MTEDHIPLREHMDILFAQQTHYIDKRFDDVMEELGAQRAHTHKGYVKWHQFVTIMVASAGVLAGVLGFG